MSEKITINLGELNLSYGIHKIKTQARNSYKEGWADSNFLEESFNVGPIIKIQKNIMTVENIMKGVTAFKINADQNLLDTVNYTATVPFTIDLKQYIGKLPEQNYLITVEAIGTDVPKNISNQVKFYLGTSRVLGIKGEPNKLVRTDHAVDLQVTKNDATGEIISDFDDIYPYSDITEVRDDQGNLFVRIPKHYTKYTKTSDGTLATQISKEPMDDTWVLNPCFIDDNGQELDYVDIGKYSATGTSTKVTSVSGASPLVNITIKSMRAACKANGVGYQQFDFWMWRMLQDLFKIEFATLDSQSIMYGYANSNPSAIRSGTCDTLGVNKSGSNGSLTDGKHVACYRGIENLWGNVDQWADGINFQGNKIYINTKSSTYASDTYTGDYKVLSYDRSRDDYIESLGYDEAFPFAQYPNKSGAKNYGDYVLAGGAVLLVGGYWGSGSNAGLFCAYGNNASSTSSSGVGGRLCRKQIL